MSRWNDPSCERLERRDLLAADLTCAINAPGSNAALERGVQYAGTLSVTNSGDSLGSDARIRVQVYLTQDATFNAATAVALSGASVLFQGALFSGDTQSDTFVYTLPSSLAGGTWRMFAWADPSAQVPESNRGNNISQATAFTLSGTGGGGTDPVAKVDLTSAITLLNSSLIINAPIRLNVTVTNAGDDALPTTGSFAQVYRTRGTVADPLVDQAVGDTFAFQTSLAHNASISAEVTFTLSEADSTGQWRFYAVVDGSNQTVETNETNNTSTLVSGQFNLGVRDIAGQIESTTLPGQFVQGQKFSKNPTIRYSYRNASDFAMAKGSSMSVRAYLRPTSAIDASTDIALTSSKGESVSNLGAGVVRTRDLAAKVPATLAAGTYRLVVMLDETNKITEINEYNNLLELGTFITVLAPTFDPALGAVTLAYPPSIKAGKSGKVSLELNNLGNSLYKNSVTIEFYFLNADGVEVSTQQLSRKVEIRTDKALKLSNLAIKAPATAGMYTMGVRLLLPASVSEIDVFNNFADLGQVAVTA